MMTRYSGDFIVVVAPDPNAPDSSAAACLRCASRSSRRRRGSRPASDPAPLLRPAARVRARRGLAGDGRHLLLRASFVLPRDVLIYLLREGGGRVVALQLHQV